MIIKLITYKYRGSTTKLISTYFYLDIKIITFQGSADDPRGGGGEGELHGRGGRLEQGVQTNLPQGQLRLQLRVPLLPHAGGQVNNEQLLELETNLREV